MTWLNNERDGHTALEYTSSKLNCQFFCKDTIQ